MNRLPKCKYHKEKFIPKYPFQKFCLSDDECIKAFNEFVKAEKEKQRVKQWQKEKKVIKESLKTKSDYESDLQDEINHIARLIDKETGCISCGGQKSLAGGHYHSVGSNKTIRFHLDNIHLQDFYCNNWKSANTHKYDLGLIERYGNDYWNYIKFDIPKLFPLLKMAKNDYVDKIKTARQIVKELQKADLTYSAKVRLELRKKFNERLGIYV